MRAGYRGKAWFEIAVDVIGQPTPARLPFSWNAGEVMPFDDVTAIHGDPVHTYVGKTAFRLKFAARWLPGRLRKQMRDGQGLKDSLSG